VTKRWKIFWVVWLACLAPVLWSLTRDGGTHLSGGKVMAHIEKLEGSVTIRSERQMIWQKAKAKQALYANDMISTEAKSRANITFEGGRKLQLSPESVIKLGTASPLSKDQEISVLKGRLIVKAEDPKTTEKATVGGVKEPESEARLILKTNEGKVIAKANDNKTLVANADVRDNSNVNSSRAVSDGKSIAGAKANFNSPLEALRNLSLTNSMSLSALGAPPTKDICPPPPPAVEPLPVPLPLDEDAELAEIPEFDPKLLPQLSPMSGEFWTVEPMKKMNGQPLRLDIDLPLKMPKELSQKWKGIVNISGPKGHIRIDGKATSGRRKVNITPKDMIDAGVIEGLDQSSFAVNVGYSVQADGLSDVIEHTSPNIGVYGIRSLAEGEGIMIGFNKIKTGSSETPWYFVNPKTDKRIWIGVTEPEDRRKLFSIVRGNSGDVARVDWPGIPAEGAFIVRKDRIVGLVSGQNLNEKEWSDIRKLFHADLIFRGSSKSYIQRTNFNPAKTNESKLFVFNKGDFVELDVSLLRTRPNTMRFIQGLSTYIFSERPEILSLAP